MGMAFSYLTYWDKRTNARADLPFGPVCFSAWCADWPPVATCGRHKERRVLAEMV